MDSRQSPFVFCIFTTQFAMLFVVPSQAQTQLSEPEVEQILKQTLDAYRARPSAYMELEMFSMPLNLETREFEKAFRHEIRFFTDGYDGRVQVNFDTYSIDNSGEVLYRSSNTLWDGDRYLEANTSPRLARVKAYTATTPTYRRRVLERHQTGILLDGDGLLQDHFAAVFLRAGAAKTARLIDGPDNTQNIHLRAVTSLGACEVWLEPDSPYLLRRIELIKGKSHMGTSTVEQYMTQSRLSVDIHKYEVIDGVQVAIQGTLEVNIEGKDFIPALYHFERKKIVWSPDFDEIGAFEIRLPTGTLVRALDLSGVRYIANGSVLSPYVDEEMLASIEDAVNEASANEIQPDDSLAPDPNQDSASQALTSEATGMSNRTLFSLISAGVLAGMVV